MKPFIAVLAALVLSVSAFAHNHREEGGGRSQTTDIKNTNSATSKSSSNSSSDSDAVATSRASATGGESSASSTSGGNSQVTNYTVGKSPVSTALAGVGETTADCRYHDGAGIQLLGVGLSGGKSRKDADCSRLKLAQYLYSRGDSMAGDRVMCNISLIKEALGDDCLALVNQLQPATVVETPKYTGATRDQQIIEKATGK